MLSLDRSLSQRALQAAEHGLWTLEPGQALTLRPGRAGDLRIARGAVWVTYRGPHEGTEGGPQGDLVLTPGMRLAVNAGDALVLEPIAAPRVPLERVTFDWTERRRLAQLWASLVGRPAAELGHALADTRHALGRLASGVLGFCRQWRRPDDARPACAATACNSTAAGH